MLANASKYAVRAIVYLVNNSSEKNKRLIKQIAENTGVPRPYLSKILQQLAQKGLISSTKGPNGGIYLSKPQLKASLYDIIVAAEGKDRLKQCALNFENCDAQNPCPIHDLIAQEKEALRFSFTKVTLESLHNN